MPSPKRYIAALLLSFVLLVFIAAPVLAWAFRAQYTVTETGGTSYDMLPVMVDSNIQWMADNGFMDADALDTRVETLGGSDKPHSVASDRILTAIPVPSDSQTNLYFTTGETPSASFYIITGVDGYVTIADTAALEPGDDFTDTVSGYFDTSETGNIIDKPFAYGVATDGAGNIDATIRQGQPIVGGHNDPMGGGATEYSCVMGGVPWNAAEANVLQVVPTAGVFRDLRIELSAALGAGETTTFHLTRNGVATDVTVALAVGDSTGSITTEHAVFAAGDTISLRCVTVGAGATDSVAWSTTFIPETYGETIFMTNGLSNLGATQYGVIQGYSPNPAELNAQAPIPTAGTFSDMYVVISAAPGAATDAYKFDLRDTGADSGITVTITDPATTGNDPVNTWAVTAGDLLNMEITPLNVPAASPHYTVGMVFTPTTIGEYVIMGGDSNQPSNAAVNYQSLSSAGVAWNAAEANARSLTNRAILKDFYVHLTATPGGAATWTFDVRAESASTGLQVVIANPDTAGSDTTSSYATGNGDSVDMMSTPAGAPAAMYVHWGIVAYWPDPIVTSAVPSGEHEVVVKGGGGQDGLVTGNVAHFDGTATSNVNSGAIYNAQAKLWISLWFKLDNPYAAGSGNKWLWGKFLAGTDYIYAYLDNGSGRVNFVKVDGGVLSFSIISAATSWSADTWYHVIFSISSVNAARMIVDGGAAVTNADVRAVVNGGDFVIGDSDDPGAGNGVIGEIANVSVGIDDLIPAEEAALYTGTIPADATNIWYLDEGTGTDAFSYGTAGNDGTLDAAVSWETNLRYCDTYLTVDGTPSGVGTINDFKDISVPDNSEDWTLCESAAVPYEDTVTMEIGGVQQAWYQPNEIIVNTGAECTETTGGSAVNLDDSVNLAGYADDYWIGARVIITASTLIDVGEHRVCTDFDDANDRVTVSPAFPANTTIGDTFTVDFGTQIDRSHPNLHFNGTATSNVNAGAIYNAETDIAISMWFRLDTEFNPTTPALVRLFGKYVDGNDYLQAWFNDGTGNLNFRNRTGSTSHYTLISAETTWLANTWYHIIFSVSSTHGGRLIVNGGTAVTDADTAAIVNGGDFVLGDQDDPGTGSGLIGELANVSTFLRDLTPAEEAALYAGTVPADATDYWYIDEGIGTAITSYGTVANPGTADIACYWETGYATTARPNSGTRNDARITWGVNPTGTAVTLGSMMASSQPSIGGLADEIPDDILPDVPASDWFVPPALATLVDNPLRPFVTLMSDTTTISELQAWRLLGSAFVLLVTVGTAAAVRNHLLIAGIVGSSSIGLMVALTIFPFWTLVFIIVMLAGGVVAERSPTV